MHSDLCFGCCIEVIVMAADVDSREYWMIAQVELMGIAQTAAAAVHTD